MLLNNLLWDVFISRNKKVSEVFLPYSLSFLPYSLSFFTCCSRDSSSNIFWSKFFRIYQKCFQSFHVTPGSVTLGSMTPGSVRIYDSRFCEDLWLQVLWGSMTSGSVRILSSRLCEDLILQVQLYFFCVWLVAKGPLGIVATVYFLCLRFAFLRSYFFERWNLKKSSYSCSQHSVSLSTQSQKRVG